jgi:hypothetical protein
MNNIAFRTLMTKGKDGATITSIDKISAEGGVMKMRITMSDGDTVDFDVNDTPDEEVIKQWIAEESVGAWKLISKESKPDWKNLSSVDISSVVDDAKEFLVLFYVRTSDIGQDGYGYNSSISFNIPNCSLSDDPTSNREKCDYINGYYYDAEYNGCAYIRYNRTAKTIKLMTPFTKIHGSDSVGGTLCVYWR